MSGPDQTTPPASRADARRNRDRILEAGATLLATDPNATLVDIALAAGVSRATVYRHFADIDALRAGLFGEAEEVGRTLLREHIPPMLGNNEAETVTEFLDLFRTALPMEHRWTKVMASEPHSDAGFIESFGPVARALIKRGQTKGDFRADLDVDLVAEALIALAMFAVRKVHAEGVDPDRALEIIRPYLDGMSPGGRR